MKQHQSDPSSTQNLMGIKDISDYSIQTPHGELVLYIIKPTNISVLSEGSISARIYALVNVLKGMAEIEMLCLNSRENFDDNKRNLKERVEKDIFPYLNRIEKSLKEQGFAVSRAGKEDIKRICAVYFEQNVTSDRHEDFDGERWVVLESTRTYLKSLSYLI